MESKKYSKGFTIIELMIAIALFGFFITIIYSSFSTITKSSAILKDRTDIFDNASNALRIMENDLKSIYVLKEPEYKKPNFDNEEEPFKITLETEFIKGKEFSKLSFTSLNHIPLGNRKEKKITRIDYFISSDGENGFVLKRRDNPNFGEDLITDEIIAYTILENIDSFFISFDGNKKKGERNWTSQSSEYAYSTPEKAFIEIIMNLNGEKQKIKSSIKFMNRREALN